MREAISAPDAPRAIGPYSQAVRAGGFLFVSGQVPFDPATGQLIEGDIGAQTRRVLLNLDRILQAGGSSLRQVVRCTVFLADMEDFSSMNEAYGTFFEAPYPARTTIQAAGLPRRARIEIDAIATV